MKSYRRAASQAQSGKNGQPEQRQNLIPLVARQALCDYSTSADYSFFSNQNSVQAEMVLSLSDLINAHAEHDGPASALLAPGRVPLSYANLYQQIVGVVETLNESGLGWRDRVAIVLPNGPEMAVASVAVCSAMTSAPLNPAYSAQEFDFYLTDLRAQALIVLAGTDSPAITAVR